MWTKQQIKITNWIFVIRNLKFEQIKSRNNPKFCFAQLKVRNIHSKRKRFEEINRKPNKRGKLVKNRKSQRPASARIQFKRNLKFE